MTRSADDILTFHVVNLHAIRIVNRMSWYRWRTDKSAYPVIPLLEHGDGTIAIAECKEDHDAKLACVVDGESAVERTVLAVARKVVPVKKEPVLQARIAVEPLVCGLSCRDLGAERAITISSLVLGVEAPECDVADLNNLQRPFAEKTSPWVSLVGLGQAAFDPEDALHMADNPFRDQMICEDLLDNGHKIFAIGPLKGVDQVLEEVKRRILPRR